MASSETSIRHAVRVQPDPSVPVEAVLLAVGDQVGHANLSHASRMNKGVVVFLKEERFVAELIVSGVSMNGVYLQVSPLAVPTARVTVSGVPPFIPDVALERELQRFGKMASGFRTVALGCKSEKLKHVQSFRRQVFMFLNCPTQTLDVSFRVKHGEGHYMVYASTGSMKCFECGDVGHKRTSCPHRPAGGRPEPGPGGPSEPAAGGPAAGGAGRAGGRWAGRAVGAGGRWAGGGAAGAGAQWAGEAGGRWAGGGAQLHRRSARRGVGGDRGSAGGGGAPPTESEVGEGHSGQVNSPGEEQRGDLGREERQVAEEEPAVRVEEVGGGSSGNGPAADSGQSQAAGSKVGGGESGAMGSVAAGEKEEEMESDTDSDCVSVADSQSYSGDLYTLEEINDFLDETFGKSVKVSEFFPDAEKFIKSVVTLQKIVGADLLDEKKRFRLKKHMTSLRKALKTRGKGKKRLRVGK
ncbi:Transposon TX1 uncharacterized protein [Merluccius polli]|uniref:Transposon TX1 uncharacterized protein n=1 Tax=Merluccius polli TaxID=89951 RepID=A0AA47MZN0_MERPO|nr:Transposon TX1 uncharacterized protein [Merluccius polli]